MENYAPSRTTKNSIISPSKIWLRYHEPWNTSTTWEAHSTTQKSMYEVCHGRTASYVVYTDYHWDRFFSFLPPSIPTRTVPSRARSMTRSLLFASITFDPMTHTRIHDSVYFFTILYCSIPRTRILGITASGGASKPSSLV